MLGGGIGHAAEGILPGLDGRLANGRLRTSTQPGGLMKNDIMNHDEGPFLRAHEQAA